MGSQAVVTLYLASSTSTPHPHPPTHPPTHTYTHRDAVQSCFGPIIQNELDEFRDDWNNHRIRKSTMSETVHGIPELMYFSPTHYGQLMDKDHVFTKINNMPLQVPKTTFVRLIKNCFRSLELTMQSFLNWFALSFKHLQSRLCSPISYSNQEPGRKHCDYT